MGLFSLTPCTAFDGFDLLARGPLRFVASAVRAAQAERADARVLIFDDRTGRVIDVDVSGSEDDMLARLDARSNDADTTPQNQTAPAGRGRPRLGVVPREVTLLPRHWDWLAQQPGGASQALRRLVDAARAADAGRTTERVRCEAAYTFMSSLGGNLPSFEEAARALFARDLPELEKRLAGWPVDVRDHVLRLAGTEGEA